MKFYDFNFKGRNYNSDTILLKEAKNLGWDYVKLNYNLKDYYNAQKYIGQLKKVNINFDMGLEIKTNKGNELNSQINKNRNKIKYISVHGGSDKINRQAVENIKLDTLNRTYYKRPNCGLNQVLSKEAVKNNIAIELTIKDILTNHSSYRAKIIDHYKEIIKLHRKFKFPLLLTTGATNIYDVKSPRDAIAIFKSIGLTDGEIEEGFTKTPEKIIDYNNKRKDMIIQGVRKIE